MESQPRSPKSLYLTQAALFLCIAIIDQLLKQWAQGLDSPIEWSWIHFFPYTNRGVIGGYLSDLNPWIVRIFFSVVFGFLSLGTFLLLHLMQHKRTPLLKWGLVVYLAGILGNVWDRMSTGKVVDYLIFQFFDLDDMAFNFADLVVVGGFFLIAIAIFKEAESLWFERNTRQGHWVAPAFQRHFGWICVLIGFAHFVVIGLYSFTFLKVFVAAPAASAGDASVVLDGHRIIQDYLFGLFAIEGGGLILTFGMSIVFSHRMIGPLIALEQFVKQLADRKKSPGDLKLRRGDYFQDRIEVIARDARALEATRVLNQNPLE